METGPDAVGGGALKRHLRSVHTAISASLAILLLLVHAGCARGPGEQPWDLACPAGRTEITDPTPVPWVSKDQPIIEAFIDGRGPFRFLVDTGATGVAVDRTFAQRMGWPICIKPGNNVVYSADDRTTAIPEWVTIPEIRAGGATFRRIGAMAMDWRMFSYHGTPQVDIVGILGAGLFAECQMTIDYPKRTVRFQTGSLPPVDGDTILPLSFVHGVPYVEVRIGDDHESQTRWMCVDTGALGSASLMVDERWLLPVSCASSTGGARMTIDGITIDPPGRIVRVPLMFLGGHVFSQNLSEKRASPDPATPHGRIGHEQFHDGELTLDMGGHRLGFRSPSRIHDGRPYWRCGFLALRCAKDRMEVVQVEPTGPAAGILHPGDIISRWNGQPACELPSNEECAAEPEQILTVQHNEGTHEVRLMAFDGLPMTPQIHDGLPRRTKAFATYQRVAFAISQPNVQQWDTLMTDLNKAAQDGEPAAWHLLGYLHQQAKNAENQRYAIDCYRRASAQGYLPSEVLLGSHLVQQADPASQAEGRRLLQRGDERGLSIAGNPEAAATTVQGSGTEGR